MFENISQIIIGVVAVFIGIGILWALMLGLKQIGLHFKDYRNYRGSVLSAEDAAEVKMAIEAYRMAKKADNAAKAQA